MPRVPVRVSFLALVAAAMLAGACGGSSGDTASVPELQVVDPDADSYDYDYVIPSGTAKRVDRGEQVEIVPAELDVKVGESIRIVNEDERGTAVGVFWVPAERTVAMEFTTPGTLTGQCDVHPSGVFSINVTDA